MYFVFIYDNKYMKSDRDFFGDAIISFYPNEKKESNVFLLGQLIGAIEFFKGLVPTSNVEQFSLDKLIFCLRPLNQQFLMVIASDQIALNSELLLEKKLAILFNLIKMVNGPISAKDRTDEDNYNKFKHRINEITTICCESLFNTKNIAFDSYYSFVSKNLQVKIESRCNNLMNYSTKQLNAFAALLFFDDRILSTGIKAHMILNLLYFLTNEQTNLIEHCEPVNELLDTPSGCHLVKVYLPKRWLSHLIKEPNESSSQNLDENSFEIVDKKNSNDDLVMDILPKSTRFRTKISLSSFTQFNTDYSNDLTNEFFDDGIDQEIALYIQKNSKLSLVLMCLDSMSDKYTKDFIQKIWQKIVNNFSDLELDLMEEQRNISDLVPRNSITDNNGLPYSCVIDRNQIIKNSFFGKSNSVPRSTMSNMNLYYELFKAIPELTKMDINKKSNAYSFSKQTMATISSSTLQVYELNESVSSNNKSTKDKKDFEFVDANISIDSSISAKSCLNYGDVLIQCSQVKPE